MTNSCSMLTLRSVNKQYVQGGNVLTVLRDISCVFQQGHLYAITGVSGSGKSTLLHLLGSLDQPTSGSVRFNDHDLTHMKKKQKSIFLNRHVGFVFQFHYLVKELSVIENIMMPGLIAGQSHAACLKRAHELLNVIDMATKAHAMPSQLSGGESQRVALARALFNKPSFLLADEPTASLDGDNVQRMVDMILAAHKEWGMGVVMCSHDSDVFNRMTTIYRLHDGVLHGE